MAKRKSSSQPAQQVLTHLPPPTTSGYSMPAASFTLFVNIPTKFVWDVYMCAICCGDATAANNKLMQMEQFCRRLIWLVIKRMARNGNIKPQPLLQHSSKPVTIHHSLLSFIFTLTGPKGQCVTKARTKFISCHQQVNPNSVFLVLFLVLVCVLLHRLTSCSHGRHFFNGDDFLSL